jgi:hypothetical protein
MRLLILTLLCLLYVNKVEAKQSFQQFDCSLQEGAEVSLLLNGKISDISKTSNLLDEKANEILKFAKQNNIEAINVVTKKMVIYHNIHKFDSPLEYNGEIIFNVAPAKKSYELLNLLYQKKYNVTLKTNNHANGGCQH